MSLPNDPVRQLRHLYNEFLREHVGLIHRHDVCISLEFIVWMRTRHPTLMNFAENPADQISRVREWLGMKEL